MQFLVDLSNPSERMNFINSLNQFAGQHRIDIVKFRKRRSDKQNRAYWPCIVTPFHQALRERGYNDISEDQSHEILKKTFLERTLHDANGEITYTWVESTTKLNTKEFAEYVEQCCQLLAEEFGINVEIGYEHS